MVNGKEAQQHMENNVYKKAIEYIKNGWIDRWGDGAIYNDDIIILMIDNKNGLRDYVIISKYHNDVIFHDVRTYSC